jgi:hypothetical protein
MRCNEDLITTVVTTVKCHMARFFAIRKTYHCNLPLQTLGGLVFENVTVEVEHPAYWALRGEPIEYLAQWFPHTYIYINGQEYEILGTLVRTAGREYEIYGKLTFKFYGAIPIPSKECLSDSPDLIL